MQGFGTKKAPKRSFSIVRVSVLRGQVSELTNTINHIICFAIKIQSSTPDIS